VHATDTTQMSNGENQCQKERLRRKWATHGSVALQSNEVCAMTRVTLFELWKPAKKDQAETQKYILQTNGELRL
jgi:hypothetical protein